MTTEREVVLGAIVDATNALAGIVARLMTLANTLRAAAPTTGEPSTGTTPPATEPARTEEPQPPPTSEPVPTAPPSTGAPTAGLGLSGAQMVGDDFASYPDVATFLKSGKLLPSETKHPELFALDKVNTFNGHQTLRANQPGGTAAQPSFSLGFAAKPKVWARATLRFDAVTGAWSAYGQPTSDDASCKLFSLGLTTDGRVGVHTANGHNLQLFVDAIPRSGVDPIAATYAERVVNGAVQVGMFSLHVLGVELGDKGWNDLIVCAENLTQAEAAAAYAKAPALYPAFKGKAIAGPCFRGRLWFGKVGAASLVGVLMAPIAGGSPVAMNRAAFLENFNQTRYASQHQAINWARGEIVDGSTQSNPFNVPNA